MNFGVIIPTYNRPALLKECLLQLQKQTYPHWTAYIVDDASRSDTRSHIEEILQNDPRVRYHRFETNRGVNAARNFALDLIEKDEDITHITLLDDDDYFVPDYFQEMRQTILRTRKAWIASYCVDDSFCKITQINTFGDVAYIDYLSGKNLMVGDATMMMEKKSIQGIRFSTTIKSGLEWYFFLQLSLRTPMYVVETIGKVVRYQEDGLSNRPLPYNKKALLKKALKAFGYNYYQFLADKNIGKYNATDKKMYLYKSKLYQLLTRL